MPQLVNQYDGAHVTMAHPLMSGKALRDTYLRAWKVFYTMEHVETLMRRAVACGIKTQKIMKLVFVSHAIQEIEGVHPLQGGLFRRKYRRDRRPGRPIENPFVFYPRYGWECVSKTVRLVRLYRTYKRLRRRVEEDPAKGTYLDSALSSGREGALRPVGPFPARQAAM